MSAVPFIAQVLAFGVGQVVALRAEKSSRISVRIELHQENIDRSIYAASVSEYSVSRSLNVVVAGSIGASEKTNFDLIQFAAVDGRQPNPRGRLPVARQKIGQFNSLARRAAGQDSRQKDYPGRQRRLNTSRINAHSGHRCRRILGWSSA
jgi:hypothetical protein